MKPLVPVAPGTRVVLGIAFFVLFVAVWALATFGGFVSKTFLADPLTMLKSGYTLLVEMGFAHDIGMTVWRVLGGFLIAAVLALPLGVLMGAYKPIEAFFEPFVSFARYLPASSRSVGSFVSPQSGTLATIVQQDPIGVTFPVSQRDSARPVSRPMALLSIFVEAMPASVGLDGSSPKRWAGCRQEPYARTARPIGQVTPVPATPQ